MPKQEYYDRANNSVAGLTDDQKYSLLSNSRRRAIVSELHQDAPLTKSELADRITDREHQPGDSWEDARKRVYISLHQQHLEKLKAVDVLREGNEGIVLGPNAHHLLEELDPPGGEGGGFRDRLGSMVKGFS